MNSCNSSILVDRVMATTKLYIAHNSHFLHDPTLSKNLMREGERIGGGIEEEGGGEGEDRPSPALQNLQKKKKQMPSELFLLKKFQTLFLAEFGI